MAAAFERTESKDGLKVKVYRGEGVGLLAFDLAREKAGDDFAGFSVEVKYPGSPEWRPLTNRLAFEYKPGDKRTRFPSTEAPFQKFRWVHVPREVVPGEFRYRVVARYMRPDGSLKAGARVENAISLEAETIGNFVNVGFTRGFASSQAYAERFRNEARILPRPGAPGAASLDHDMRPFEKHYAWLGFEARRIVYDVLDQAVADPAVTVDAMIYECKEPGILARLAKLKGRLRAIVDDHGEQGHGDSAESISAGRLAAAGATVQRMHFGRQQHNKVFIVKRQGKPAEVLTGSTNFSLRGLYIQANNALHFRSKAAADLYANVFEAYWTDPKAFRKNPLSQQWWVFRDVQGSRVSATFSPKADSGVSLDPIAGAIEDARSSVLYSIVFLNQLTGKVREALDELMDRSLFSYGVAQRTGGLDVVKPDGSRGLLPFAYLASKAPQPFKREWSGNTTERSNMVHHKFLVTDFNGSNPTVFTGSSNLAKGGEEANGDNVLCIQDRKVAIAYAIEALRMFDHFHFRVNVRENEPRRRITLWKPPRPGRKPWHHPYYSSGHVKERDRLLFSGEGE